MRRKTAIGDQVFGRYRIDSLLGEGGQGFVWKGTDASGGSRVAIKELTSESADLRKRFEREMALKLDHPNIIQVSRCGEDAGNYYFVMEFLDGENLGTILEKRGRLAEPEAVRIIAEVADALACAHENNIIHRDIKPENIMVLRDGRVKITDFGIACFLDKERVTKIGATMGTAHYMSPEQVEDVSKVDSSSDIFSLGVVLYETLTGVKPFDAELLGELYVQIISKEPPPPAKVVAGISPLTDGAVMKMLRKAPEQRPPDMRAVLVGLGRKPEVRAPAAADPHGQTQSMHVLPAPAPAAGPAAPRKKARTGVPCPACRTVNALGSSFCGKCGYDLRRTCAHCQHPMPTGSAFCARCGHPVAQGASRGWLTGLKGGYVGQRIPVDRDFITFGRHAQNDVSFGEGKDEYVSRFQARLYREKGMVWLEGWDWVKNGITTNGTFVNGRNIDGKGRVALRNGDKIRLGDSFFRFETDMTT